MNRTWIALGIASSLLLGSAAWATESATDAAPDPSSRLCEYGITLALSRQDERAESVFVALLSRIPHDARALNNLGNLRLWKGEADMALAFYNAAAGTDPDDAGITTNEAIAWAIAGDDSLAEAGAAEAVSRAGGPAETARLLGLRYTDLDADGWERGSDAPRLSREKALALLRIAARAVPPDTTQARNRSLSAGQHKQVPTWRSAGPRASSALEPAVVYWKR